MIPKFLKRPPFRKLRPHPAVLKSMPVPPPVSLILFQPPLFEQQSNIPTLGVGEYQCVRAMERHEAVELSDGAEPAEVIAAMEAHGAAPKPQE